MRKTITRALAAFLCLAMLATCAFVVSAAGDYKDIENDKWYYGYVTYMSDKGIINGYQDNTFRPNKEVRRAEFIKMMVETFGLTATTSVSYNDVSSGDWYYDHYRKAAAQGFIDDVFTSKMMRPTENLTREEAAALLMAYLDYPDEEKASSTTFSDYNDIDDAFAGYVLQAVEAKIIDGFNEGNHFTFRPTATLTRAQAAKILSVAAGTIANVNVSNALDFTDSNNLVVTKSNVTVKNLVIPGNVIISEGVTSGTINFVNCDIEGTVSNRSKATVCFANGTVEELNLDVVSADVQLKQSVEVGEVNAFCPNANVEFFTNAVVEDFNVFEGSTGVKVTGTSGEIDDLVINANSFSSTITPKNCDIDSEVSATVGGVSYKEGVKGSFKIYWADSKEYIDYETYKDGSIQYYYTTSSTVPTKTNFKTNYDKASAKKSFTVTADKASFEELSGDNISTEEFQYVAVALVDGSTVVSSPVVINRESAKYGFKVMPTLATNNTADTIKGTVVASGTLYYYYTNEDVVPSTFTAAQNVYKATESAAKGNFTCTSSVSKETKKIDAVDIYAYCVVYFIDDNDTQYKPILLERPELTSGLSTEPYITISDKEDGVDVLTITSSSSATIKVLYTDSTLNFTSSTFADAYEETDEAIEDEDKKLTFKQSVKAGKETTIELANSKLANEMHFDYALVQIGNTTPIMVTRYPDADGFTELPVVLKTPSKDMIVFTPYSFTKSSVDPVVRYFYSNVNKTYTSETFEKAYEEADDQIKDSFTVTPGILSDNNTSDKDSSNINEKYVVFMLTSVYGNHLPVTVIRSDIGNGFVGTPTIEYHADEKVAKLKFTVQAPHDIEYFTLSAEEYKQYGQDTIDYMFSTNKASGLKKIFKSTAGIKQGENVKDLESVVNASTEYVAVRAVDLDKNKAYKSVVVKVAIIDDGIEKNAAGDPNISFGRKDGEVLISFVFNENAVGKTLKYYYSATEPKKTSDYTEIFSDSKISGQIRIEKSGKTADYKAGSWAQILDCKYLVYKVVDAKGASMTYGYKKIDERFLTAGKITYDKADGVINFAPTEKGEYILNWFFSTSELDITRSNFMTNKGRASANYKGERTYAGGDANTDFKQPAANKPQYKFLYVMIQTKIDNKTTNYYPVSFDLEK